MEKELIHENCGGKVSFEDDSSGCGDPECCGGPTYHIDFKCEKCGKKDTIWL